jgi:hypothetical protein
MIPLQPTRGVEDGFAVPRDQIAAGSGLGHGRRLSTPCGAKATDFRVYVGFMQAP